MSVSQSEVDLARAYLLKSANASGGNLFDHLSKVLQQVLTERPANPLDSFEDLSRDLKSREFKVPATIKNQLDPSASVALAKTREPLFKSVGAEDPDDSTPPVVSNFLESAAFFEDGGVGLGREESFRVFLSMRQLAEKQPLKSVRFWGKIFGVEKNYFIAECEYRDGEEPQPEEKEKDEPAPEEAAPEEGGLPPIPKSAFKPAPPLPVEEYGSGNNKRVYFVTNEPGQEWALLPHVTPEQVSVARQIRKLVTGNLSAPVVSFPPFPGNEMNYLRAQIARISGATHISPLGFFKFEDEDEEDEAAREKYIVDEEFEGKSRTELVDSTLAGWAHHTMYVLPQGRCRWVNPNPPKEEADDGDEDEDAEEEEEPTVEPETGPPLLSPVQSDEEIGGQPAWTTRFSLQLQPSLACVIVSSNRWPGAFAYGQGKKFDNIYVGWGQKFEPEPYSPPLVPALQQEYINPDANEAPDPTREEEAAYEASLIEAAEDKEQAEEDAEDGDDE